MHRTHPRDAVALEHPRPVLIGGAAEGGDAVTNSADGLWKQGRGLRPTPAGAPAPLPTPPSSELPPPMGHDGPSDQTAGGEAGAHSHGGSGGRERPLSVQTTLDTGGPVPTDKGRCVEPWVSVCWSLMSILSPSLSGLGSVPHLHRTAFLLALLASSPEPRDEQSRQVAHPPQSELGETATSPHGGQEEVTHRGSDRGARGGGHREGRPTACVCTCACKHVRPHGQSEALCVCPVCPPKPSPLASPGRWCRPTHIPSPRGHLLLSERKCWRMRARDPLLARSARAPGQLGIRRAWYRAPGGRPRQFGHRQRGRGRLGHGAPRQVRQKQKQGSTLEATNPPGIPHLEPPRFWPPGPLTINGLQLGGTRVGLEAEILHPAGVAVVNVHEVYGPPLQEHGEADTPLSVHRDFRG